MKKIFAIVASLAIAASFANAQEVDSKSVATNNFGSNWFVGAGAGVNVGATYKGPGSGIGAGVAADLTIGKWFSPELGVAADIYGVTADFGKNVDASVFGGLNANILWNVTNQFKGYDPDRKYNFVPYVTFGAFKSAGFEFAAGAGILNVFKLTEKLDANINLRGLASHGEDFGQGNGGLALLATAELGITYKFGKQTGWQSTSAVAAAAAAAAAEAALAKAAADKAKSDAEKDAAHAAEIAKLQAEKDAAVKAAQEAGNDDTTIAKMLKNVPASVHFEIGQAKLSKKELQHFDFYAKNLVAGSTDLKFIVTSSADKATGTARRNKQLMEQRGKYVGNLLTEKYGVDASRITIVSDTEGLYSGNGELGRVSVITVAE